MASTSEHDGYFKPTDRILTGSGVQEEAKEERKMKIGLLEWQVFGAIRQRMSTATPMALLHIYLSLAVASGTFTQAEMNAVGVVGLKMMMEIVSSATLACATSWEMIAVATCGATFHKLGTAAA